MMPIHDPDLDRLLHLLERHAEDELALLESTGPEFFSTAQLWRLHGQWEVKNRLFRLGTRRITWLAAASPVWIGGWALFYFLGWPLTGLMLLMLFPLSWVLFFAGLYFMRTFFRGKGHLDKVGDLIAGELQKREGVKRGKRKR